MPTLDTFGLSLPAFTALGRLVISPGIEDVEAIGEARIRIRFDEEMKDNDALVDRSNYAINTIHLGAVPVVVNSVVAEDALNPQFVDLLTSEHTDSVAYNVVINSGLNGPVDTTDAQLGLNTMDYAAIGSIPFVDKIEPLSLVRANVIFNEVMLDTAELRDPARYTWDNGLVTTGVLGVVGGDTVQLVTTEQTPGTLYTLTVNNAGLVFDQDLPLVPAILVTSVEADVINQSFLVEAISATEAEEMDVGVGLAAGVSQTTAADASVGVTMEAASSTTAGEDTDVARNQGLEAAPSPTIGVGTMAVDITVPNASVSPTEGVDPGVGVALSTAASGTTSENSDLDIEAPVAVSDTTGTDATATNVQPITVVGTAKDYASTSTLTDLTPVLPTVAAGDLMIAFAGINEFSTAAGFIEADPVWGRLWIDADTNDTSYVWFKFVESASEPDPDFALDSTGSGSVHGFVQILVLRGAGTPVVDATIDNSSSTTNHDIVHTEGAEGLTAIGIFVVNGSNSVNVNGSIKTEGADWDEVLTDSGTTPSSSRSAHATIYREDTNLGSETSGVTSSSSATSKLAAVRTDPFIVTDQPIMIGHDEGYSEDNNNITLTLPAAAAVGDLMYMICGQEPAGDSTVDTPTSGGTWTLLGAGHSDVDSIIQCYYRTVAASEPDPVAIFGGTSTSNDNFAVLLVFTNCDTTPTSHGTTADGASPHEVSFTEPSTGVTVIGQILEDGSSAVTITGQHGDAWQQIKVDDQSPHSAQDAALSVVWRYNEDRGSTIGGCTSSGPEDSDSWRATIETV